MSARHGHITSNPRANHQAQRGKLVFPAASLAAVVPLQEHTERQNRGEQGLLPGTSSKASLLSAWYSGTRTAVAPTPMAHTKNFITLNAWSASSRGIIVRAPVPPPTCSGLAGLENAPPASTALSPP